MDQAADSNSQKIFHPVSEAERISSVDTLRGFAVLGILTINIVTFGMPGAVLFNPTAYGDFSGINEFTWRLAYTFFFQKFIAIFSMLFGAGVILMHRRFESTGRPFAKIYYRRLLWLWVIGIVHAYLLWYGDILFSYAVCGLLLYPLKRFSGKVLLIVGIAVFLTGLLPQIGMGYIFDMFKSQAMEARELMDAGEEVTSKHEEAVQIWENMKGGFNPTREQVAGEVELYRGGFWEIFVFRAIMSFMLQTLVLITMVFWRVMGMMLIGMGLMKLGVFSASRSKRFYLIGAITGYLIGLPIVIFGSNELIKYNFDVVYKFMTGGHYDYVGGMFVAFGHICAVMYVCKTRIWSGIRDRLASVGRMAFTNYLVQTVVMTTIFYGYGLGLFGRFNHATLMLFVVAAWIVQLYYSPVWLNYFRFGPLEWFWRTMTYGRSQPMRGIKAALEGKDS